MVCITYLVFLFLKLVGYGKFSEEGWDLSIMKSRGEIWRDVSSDVKARMNHTNFQPEVVGYAVGYLSVGKYLLVMNMLFIVGYGADDQDLLCSSGYSDHLEVVGHQGQKKLTGTQCVSYDIL